MKKNAIVYLDGDKCRLGEIDHQITIDGKEYYVMASVNIDGCYVDNTISNLDGVAAVEADLAWPVEACSLASSADAESYESRRYSHS